MAVFYFVYCIEYHRKDKKVSFFFQKCDLLEKRGGDRKKPPAFSERAGADIGLRNAGGLWFYLGVMVL